MTNLINDEQEINGSPIQPEEVDFNVITIDDVTYTTAFPTSTVSSNMSGIKGYYTTIRMSTDEATEYGGNKQLFSVGSKYVISSTL